MEILFLINNFERKLFSSSDTHQLPLSTEIVWYFLSELGEDMCSIYCHVTYNLPSRMGKLMERVGNISWLIFLMKFIMLILLMLDKWNIINLSMLIMAMYIKSISGYWIYKNYYFYGF